MSKSSVFATFTVTQIAIILTSFACIVALGSSFYYNHCQERKNSYELESARMSLTKARSERDELAKNLSNTKIQLDEVRTTTSNKIARAVAKAKEQYAVKESEMLSEIENLKTECKKMYDWAITMSNQAIAVIQRQRAKISDLNSRLENTPPPSSTHHHYYVQKTTNVKQLVTCPNCHGKGYFEGKAIRTLTGWSRGSQIKCRRCNGRGQVNE